MLRMRGVGGGVEFLFLSPSRGPPLCLLVCFSLLRRVVSKELVARTEISRGGGKMCSDEIVYSESRSQGVEERWAAMK